MRSRRRLSAAQGLGQSCKATSARLNVGLAPSIIGETDREQEVTIEQLKASGLAYSTLSKAPATSGSQGGDQVELPC